MDIKTSFAYLLQAIIALVLAAVYQQLRIVKRDVNSNLSTAQNRLSEAEAKILELRKEIKNLKRELDVENEKDPT